MLAHLLGRVGATAKDLDVVATAHRDRNPLGKVQFAGGASADNAGSLRAVQDRRHKPRFESTVTEKFGIPSPSMQVIEHGAASIDLIRGCFAGQAITKVVFYGQKARDLFKLRLDCVLARLEPEEAPT